jgi:hypothetical protein
MSLAPIAESLAQVDVVRSASCNGDSVAMRLIPEPKLKSQPLALVKNAQIKNRRIGRGATADPF